MAHLGEEIEPGIQSNKDDDAADNTKATNSITKNLRNCPLNPNGTGEYNGELKIYVFGAVGSILYCNVKIPRDSEISDDVRIMASRIVGMYRNKIFFGEPIDDPNIPPRDPTKCTSILYNIIHEFRRKTRLNVPKVFSLIVPNETDLSRMHVVMPEKDTTDKNDLPLVAVTALLNDIELKEKENSSSDLAVTRYFKNNFPGRGPIVKAAYATKRKADSSTHARKNKRYKRRNDRRYEDEEDESSDSSSSSSEGESDEEVEELSSSDSSSSSSEEDSDEESDEEGENLESSDSSSSSSEGDSDGEIDEDDEENINDNIDEQQGVDNEYWARRIEVLDRNGADENYST